MIDIFFEYKNNFGASRNAYYQLFLPDAEKIHDSNLGNTSSLISKGIVFKHLS